MCATVLSGAYTNMREFKLGDQVRYASGGPVMTISHIGPQPGNIMMNDRIHCRWFYNGVLSEADFKPFELILEETTL